MNIRIKNLHSSTMPGHFFVSAFQHTSRTRPSKFQRCTFYHTCDIITPDLPAGVVNVRKDDEFEFMICCVASNQYTRPGPVIIQSFSRLLSPGKKIASDLTNLCILFPAILYVKIRKGAGQGKVNGPSGSVFLKSSLSHPKTHRR